MRRLLKIKQLSNIPADNQAAQEANTTDVSSSRSFIPSWRITD